MSPPDRDGRKDEVRF